MRAVGLVTELFSPLMRRILAVNIFALLILLGGLFYLSDFRDNLVAGRIADLRVEAEIMAATLGDEAVLTPGPVRLDPTEATAIVTRLAEPSSNRARLFGLQEQLIADSRELASSRTIEEQMLAEPAPDWTISGLLVGLTNQALDTLALRQNFPLYREPAVQNANDYAEVIAALKGEPASRIRALEGGDLLINVAVPVLRFRRVLGALLITGTTADIEAVVRREELRILKIFGIALAVTLLMSTFLGLTIVRPVKRLARAADRVRRGIGRVERLPEFANRRDEIGDLSRALSDMTQALYRQMEAIEHFAADVAHEIKNPLSSLRSAVESLQRTDKPDLRDRLLAIIQSDIQRLDRLISDISDASRLDAELVRSRSVPVDLAALLDRIVNAERLATDGQGPTVRLDHDPQASFMVCGAESRLAQVVTNMLDNARSFTPADKAIQIRLHRDRGGIVLVIEDEGPGLPPGAEDKIFQRFYTERPPEEAFGTHSGLGLNISQQIIDAHGGTIKATNRIHPDDPDRVLGARFTIRLPAAG